MFLVMEMLSEIIADDMDLWAPYNFTGHLRRRCRRRRQRSFRQSSTYRPRSHIWSRPSLFCKSLQARTPQGFLSLISTPLLNHLTQMYPYSGYVFGPLLWGPGSELFGRRPIMTITLCLYTIFHLGQALAPNMETLLVTRFISGFFACAPLTNGGGLIADIWDPVGRGPSTSMFSTMVFLGPCFGPLVGGL